MSETYTIGGNALQKILFGQETGQSFSPLVDHTLEYIDIDVFLNSDRGIPVPHLYNSDATHEPVGGTASHTTEQTYPKPFQPGLQRLRSKMQPYPIQTGQIYIIKIYGLGTTPEYTFYWHYDKDAATYPRGHRIWRNTEFDPYTHYNDQDYIFAEWGDPPLIKLDPIPPVYFFACTALEYFHWPSTITFTLATSVPCHLTCYYTETRPVKHPRERVIRGATLPWGTYFCFVAWKEVEQTEPGDTLYHTFEMPDWIYCQYKWFTFRGTVALTDVPSIGPIFVHHHTGFVLPEVLFNLSFETWPDPAEYAHFWTPFWVGSGYGAWDREEVIVQHGSYSAKFTVGGFNHGRGFRQIQDVDAWRGMNLTFKAWALGSIHPMNRLTIGVDGTGGWLRHDSITEANLWRQLSVSGIIPDDATQIRIDVLGWSPGWGPTYTYFDNITIELTPG